MKVKGNQAICKNGREGVEGGGVEAAPRLRPSAQLCENCWKIVPNGTTESVTG